MLIVRRKGKAKPAVVIVVLFLFLSFSLQDDLPALAKGDPQGWVCPCRFGQSKGSLNTKPGRPLCWALTMVANPDFDATGDTKRKKRALDGGNLEMPFLLKEKKEVDRGQLCPLPLFWHQKCTVCCARAQREGKKSTATTKDRQHKKKGEPIPRNFFEFLFF